MDFLGLFAPKIAYAALDEFIGKVTTEIINPLILLLFALAVFFFLYGVVEFILKQENEEAKTTGKNHMIWGIVGIAIMMGVWTIMNIILNTLKIDYVDVDGGKIEVDKTQMDLPQE